MRPWAPAAALLILSALPAVAADVTSPKPDAVAVTIYRDRPMTTRALAALGDDDTHGLALVVETRTVTIPAGRSRLRFEGVADAIVPQSAGIEGLPSAIIERDFDYDLLTPATLVGRSVGETVTLARTDRRTGKETRERAVIRAAPDGVVLEVGGRIEALGCGGDSERLIYDRAPPGLAARPTLSLMINAPRAGRYDLRLSYLTVRMDWSADYVARLSPDGRTLALTGWITLANRTATAFADAPAEVVAGHLARVPVDIPSADTPTLETNCWPGQTTHAGWPPPLAQPGPPPPAPPMVALAIPAPVMQMRSVTVTARKMAIESQLGDYKLYTLAEPTTVAARQTKQVLFLDQPSVRFDKVYARTIEDYQGRRPAGPVSAAVVLRLTNTLGQGLGRPLPEGEVQLRQPQAIAGGKEVLLGAARVTRDIPVGEPFEIALGRASDVTITARAVAGDAAPPGRQRQSWEILAANARAAPVTVEIRHDRADRGDFAVAAESDAHGLKAGDPVWRLTVPARSARTLTYAVSWAAP